MSYPRTVHEDAWISEEPRLTAVARRVLARARRRPRSVLALALAATSLVVAYRALKAPAYQGALHFSLAEGDLVDYTLAPRPPRDVRGYVARVALSRQRLERIMREHRVSEAWLARDPVAAVEEFREQIGVDVQRNYFIEERHRRSAPRSAFVTISLLGAEAEQTRAVLHDVASAILQEQGEVRAGSLDDVRGLLDAELAQARERTRSIQAEIARLGREAQRAPAREAIDRRARVAALEIEALATIDRVLALERRLDGVGFTGAAEGEQLGLRFRLLDEQLTVLAPPLSPLQLGVRAAVVLAAALVVAALVVGAFDDRIYGPEDLEARGLPVLGALSRFAGDEVGPYAARAPALRAGGAAP